MKIRLKKRFSIIYNSQNILVFIYLMTFYVLYRIEFKYDSLVQYTMVAIFLIAFILCEGIIIPQKIILLSIITGITGVINIFLIGNNNIFKLGFIILSFFIAHYMLSIKVSSMVFKLCYYMEALGVFVIFVNNGLETKIFAGSSNNYVSIYLLFSILLYYFKADIEGIRIKLLPAFSFVLLCLLAQGRSGILCALLLIFFVIVFNYLNVKSLKKKNIRLFVVFVSIITLICLVSIIVEKIDFNSISSFRRFQKYGLALHGRDLIWTQYLREVLKCTKYLFWGGDVATMNHLIALNGNPHNSFLNVHVYNGIIMLAVILYLILHACLFFIKNKKYIAMSCLLVFCLRAFSDYVFWGSSGTYAFLVLVLYPFELHINKCKDVFSVNKIIK